MFHEFQIHYNKLWQKICYKMWKVCDKSLLRNVKSITKCDKMFLQSVTGIKKCGSCYKVRRNTPLLHPELVSGSF